MANRRIDLRGVKIHYSFTAEEAADKLACVRIPFGFGSGRVSAWRPIAVHTAG